MSPNSSHRPDEMFIEPPVGLDSVVKRHSSASAAWFLIDTTGRSGVLLRPFSKLAASGTRYDNKLKRRTTIYRDNDDDDDDDISSPDMRTVVIQ